MIPAKMKQQSPFSIEALMYCYSATISQLDFGVIAAKEQSILNVLAVVLGSQSLLQGTIAE